VSEMDRGFLHSQRESESASARESVSEMDRGFLHSQRESESESARESVAALDLAFCSISSSSVDVGKSIDSHDNTQTRTVTQKESTRSRGHSHGHSHRMFNSLMTVTASAQSLTALPTPSSSSSLLPALTPSHPPSAVSIAILVPIPSSTSFPTSVPSKAEVGQTVDAGDMRGLPQARLDLSDLDISQDISSGTEDDNNKDDRHSHSDGHCVLGSGRVRENRDSEMGREALEEIDTHLTPSPSQTNISTPSPVSPFSPVSLTIPPLSSPECAVSPTLPQPTLASHFNPHLMTHGHGQTQVQTHAQRWSAEVKLAQKLPMTSPPELTQLEGEGQGEESRMQREEDTKARTDPDSTDMEDPVSVPVPVPVPGVRRVRVSKYPRSESLGDSCAFAFALGGVVRTRMGSRAATRAGTGAVVGSGEGSEKDLGEVERKGITSVRGSETVGGSYSLRGTGAGTGSRKPVDPLFSARPIGSSSSISHPKGNKISQIFQQNFSRESRYTSRSPSPSSSASPSSSSSPQYLSMDSIALDRGRDRDSDSNLFCSSSSSFLRSISVSPPQHRNALLNQRILDLDSSVMDLDSSLFSPPIPISSSSTFSPPSIARSHSRPFDLQQQQLSRSVVEFMKTERKIQIEEDEEEGGEDDDEGEEEEQMWAAAGEEEGEGRVRMSTESQQSSSTCSTSILNKVQLSTEE
jgi:hypothetical protein